MTKEQIAATKELRVYLAENVAACVEYEADEDRAEYQARLFALDALLAEREQAMRDAVAYQDVYETAIEVRQLIAQDVFRRVCGYAAELAGEEKG